MSAADLAALDRGVIETGLTAAEALARVAALEARVRALGDVLAMCAREAGFYTAAAAIEPAPGPARPRHLHLVKDGEAS